MVLKVFQKHSQAPYPGDMSILTLLSIFFTIKKITNPADNICKSLAVFLTKREYKNLEKMVKVSVKDLQII